MKSVYWIVNIYSLYLFKHLQSRQTKAFNFLCYFQCIELFVQTSIYEFNVMNLKWIVTFFSYQKIAEQMKKKEWKSFSIGFQSKTKLFFSVNTKWRRSLNQFKSQDAILHISTEIVRISNLCDSLRDKHIEVDIYMTNLPWKCTKLSFSQLDPFWGTEK